MPARRSRDIERIYSRRTFAARLRRFATAVASGRAFRIQVAGGTDEVEFQIRWRRR
jgi:hypothetical protein